MVLSLQGTGLRENDFFLSFLPSGPLGGRDALWDQLYLLLGSTPCKTLLLLILSETMS